MTSTLAESPPMLQASNRWAVATTACLCALLSISAYWLADFEFGGGRAMAPLFLWGGAALALLALGVTMRWVAAGVGGTVLALICGGLLLTRIIALFVGGSLQNPDASVFHAIYAYLPLLMIITVAVVPYPLNIAVSGVLWMAVSVAITVAVGPLLQASTPRQGLMPLIQLAWVGYPAYWIMLGFASVWGEHARRHLLRRADAEHQARVHAEFEARELHRIIDNTSVGVAVLASDGAWLTMNPRICDITGYSEPELRERTFQAITHPDDLDQDLRLAQEVMSRKIERYSLNKRYIRKDGQIVYVRLSVGRIPGRVLSEDRFVSIIEAIGRGDS